MTQLPPLRFKPARDSAFRRELHAEVEQYLRERGGHRHANVWLHVKCVALAALAALMYAMALQATAAMPFTLWFIASLFAAMLLGMNWLHDGAHRALFRSPWWNRVAARAAGIAVGIDTRYWTIRHVHFHHNYANIEAYDLDIEPNPFLRQTPFHAWAPQYRYQHLYWPLVAALSLPYLVWYSDWLDFFGLTPAGARDRSGWPGRVVFLACKLVHVLLVLALPLWALHGAGIAWFVVPVAYLLGQMLASCFLVAMILGTHWAEVDFFQAGQDGSMPHDWYEHAFLTACDWTPRPRWLGYFFGGLHLHLTHHLFPTYSHRHYPALAAIVADVAARHQLRYRNLGYRQLFASQQVFLKAMGREPG